MDKTLPKINIVVKKEVTKNAQCIKCDRKTYNKYIIKIYHTQHDTAKKSGFCYKG